MAPATTLGKQVRAWRPIRAQRSSRTASSQQDVVNRREIMAREAERRRKKETEQREQSESNVAVVAPTAGRPENVNQQQQAAVDAVRIIFQSNFVSTSLCTECCTQNISSIA